MVKSLNNGTKDKITILVGDTDIANGLKNPENLRNDRNQGLIA